MIALLSHVKLIVMDVDPYPFTVIYCTLQVVD